MLLSLRLLALFHRVVAVYAVVDDAGVAVVLLLSSLLKLRLLKMFMSLLIDILLPPLQLRKFCWCSFCCCC